MDKAKEYGEPFSDEDDSPSTVASSMGNTPPSVSSDEEDFLRRYEKIAGKGTVFVAVDESDDEGPPYEEGLIKGSKEISDVEANIASENENQPTDVEKDAADLDEGSNVSEFSDELDEPEFFETVALVHAEENQEILKRNDDVLTPSIKSIIFKFGDIEESGKKGAFDFLDRIHANNSEENPDLSDPGKEIASQPPDYFGESNIADVFDYKRGKLRLEAFAKLTLNADNESDVPAEQAYVEAINVEPVIDKDDQENQVSEQMKRCKIDDSDDVKPNQSQGAKRKLTFMEKAYLTSKEFVPKQRLSAPALPSPNVEQPLEDEACAAAEEPTPEAMNEAEEEETRLKAVLDHNIYKISDESISTELPLLYIERSRFKIESQNFHIPGIEMFEKPLQVCDDYVGPCWGDTNHYAFRNHCDMVKKTLQKQIGDQNLLVYFAQENYGDYLLFENQILDHIVEMYDIDPDLNSNDLLRMLKRFHKDPLYIKWSDKTKCLVMFDCAACATRALQFHFQDIKVRPAVRCSIVSALIASRYNLVRAESTKKQTKLQ